MHNTRLTGRNVKEVFMKRKYIAPSIEVEVLNQVDIVTASVLNFNIDWIDKDGLGL